MHSSLQIVKSRRDRLVARLHLSSHVCQLAWGAVIGAVTIALSAAGPSGHIAKADQSSLNSVVAVPIRAQIALGTCCATSLAWSPDGTLLAVGGGSALQFVRTSVASGAATLATPAATRSRLSVPISVEAWSPDGRTIAAGSPDGLVRTFTPAGVLTGKLIGHAKAVTSVSWVTTGAGPLLASGSSDATVRIWQSDNTLLTTIAGDGHPVVAVAWSSSETNHGNILAIATTAGVRLQYDSGRNLAALRSVGGNARVAFSPDGQTLATGSTDGMVRLWDLGASLRATLTGRTAGVTSLAWSPDGTRLAVGSTDRTVHVWSRAGGLLSSLGGFPGPVVSLSWSPSGKQLAAAAGDASVRILTL